MLDNRNPTAYGLYSAELCKNIVRNFSEDENKKFLERQRELLDELERLGHFPNS